MLRRALFRQIRNTFARYLAIFAIIALGVGFFIGLRVTRDAMMQTAGIYLDEQNLYDFRLISTLGLTEEDVAAFSALDGVETAAGSVSADTIFLGNGETELVLRAQMITPGINELELVAGRMPEAPNEAVVDAVYLPADLIGVELVLGEENTENTKNLYAYDSYTVVGLVHAADYVNFERGSTTVGAGRLNGFVCLPAEAFVREFYTDIYLSIPDRAGIYSAAYDAQIEALKPAVSALLTERGKIRYQEVYREAEKEILNAQRQLDDGEATYVLERAEAERKLVEAQEKLTDGRAQLDQGWAELEQGKAELEKQRTAANNQLAAARAQLNNAWAVYYQKRAEWQSNYFAQFLGLGSDELASAQAQINAAEAQYAYQSQLANNALKEAEQKIADGQAELEAREAEYESGLAEYENARSEAETQYAEAEQKIADGKQEIHNGWEQLGELKEPDTYILGRDVNIGYATLENDMDIVRGISRVFPLFFFLVAALVCVTTMTRMVDEQRTQNGVLKAMGYRTSAIAGQYLVYSGSASALGCLCGFVLGSRFMPMAIWKVYQMMYAINRPVAFILDWKMFAVVSALFLAGALGTTWLVCRNDLRESAADLIRPKAPPAGSRILLERIGFIWNRIPFLQKVSIRNIFLYKKRMIMMILGVGGCTALLMAGMGIRDTIQPILDYQYSEIQTYDCEITFSHPMTDADQAAFAEQYGELTNQLAFLNTRALDLVQDGKTASIDALVIEQDLDGLLDLHVGRDRIPWPETGETVIDYRLAKEFNIQIGDPITLKDPNSARSITMTVSGIFDNYIYDIAVIRAETLTEAWGEEPEIRSALVKVSDGTDVHTASVEFYQSESVSRVDVLQDLKDMIASILTNMNYIVLIVLVCAGALAFIVIYNLTNISINERRREIATLKVLGFQAWESASYVFRENLVLTAVAAVFGLPMGYALLRYVMALIKISNFYFGCHITPLSCVISVAATFLFSILVDFLLYFKLDRIDMADSLKAVE